MHIGYVENNIMHTGAFVTRMIVTSCLSIALPLIIGGRRPYYLASVDKQAL